MMATMTVPVLFDQQLIRMHRQRAALSYANFAFLKDAAAARLALRVFAQAHVLLGIVLG